MILEIIPDAHENLNDRTVGTETPAAKKLLSAQTMDGIEFTTTAFIEVTKFLLKGGVPFINP